MAYTCMHINQCLKRTDYAAEVVNVDAKKAITEFLMCIIFAADHFHFVVEFKMNFSSEYVGTRRTVLASNISKNKLLLDWWDIILKQWNNQIVNNNRANLELVQANQVNIIIADDLVPWVARLSTLMVLTL